VVSAAGRGLDIKTGQGSGEAKQVGRQTGGATDQASLKSQWRLGGNGWMMGCCVAADDIICGRKRRQCDYATWAQV
jgi:hypothetical protein